MVKKLLPGLFMVAALLVTCTVNAQFTRGNIVVLQVGADGSGTALSSVGTALFLKEFNTTTTGQTTPVSMVSIPTTGSARLVTSGSASSEAQITLSADSMKIVLAGYDTTVGTTGIASTASALVGRAVDTVNAQGVAGRAAVTRTQYDANNFRSAARGFNDDYWGAGGNSGTYYFGYSAAAGAVQTTNTNTRVVNVFNGNLYYSTGSSPAGVYKMSGTPVSSATPVNMVTASGASPYAFAINSTETIIYVADDRAASAGGGIQKWVNSGGTWSLAYTLAAGGTAGARGLAVDFSGTNPVVYAVTTDGTGRLIKITDAGASSAFTLLATAPTNTAFRSVALAPIPCTAPTLSKVVTNQDCTTTGSVALTTSGGSAPFTYSWSGPSGFTATTQNISGLQAGTYSVTVTAHGGCTATTTAAVNNAGSVNASITAGGPLSFCPGDSVTLSSASTGAGYNYSWKKDGTTVGTSDSYRAGAAGSYTLTITYGTCSATSAAATVNVYSAPDTTLTISGSTTFCTGDSVTLSVPQGTGYTYDWKKDGVSVGSAHNYRAGASGSYRVIISNSTCTVTSAATQITVLPMPDTTLTIAGSTSFCPGDSVTLSVPQGTGYTYDWKKDGVSVGAARSYRAGASGNYTVTVNSGTCSATSAGTLVTVYTAPDTILTITGSTSFCLGDSVVLSVPQGTGYTYDWKKDGTSVGAAHSYRAVASGNYAVTVSNGTCSATSSTVSVNVYTTPDATVTVSGNTSFCMGDSVELSVPQGTGYTYDWKKDGVSVGTASVYRAGASGSYTATVTYGTCSATSAANLITVYPAPDTTLTISGSTSFCMGDSVTLSVPQGTGNVFVWSIGGTVIPGAADSFFVVHEPGDYQVKITNTNGCADSSFSVAVVVHPLPVPVISNNSNVLSTTSFSTYQWNLAGNPISGATVQQYTPTQNGSYTVTVTDVNGCANTSAAVVLTNVGLYDAGHDKEVITIAPNPVTDIVYIQARNPVTAVIKDMQGREVLSGKHTNLMHLGQLPAGIYLLQVFDQGHQLIYTGKLIKQ